MSFELPESKIITINSLPPKITTSLSLTALPTELLEKIIAFLGKDTRALTSVNRHMFHIDCNNLYWRTFAKKKGLISCGSVEDQDKRLKKYQINLNDLQQLVDATAREKISSLLPKTHYNLFCYDLYFLSTLDLSNSKYLKKLTTLANLKLKNKKIPLSEREQIFKKCLLVYSRHITFIEKHLRPSQELIPQYESCIENSVLDLTQLCNKMRTMFDVKELELLDLFLHSQNRYFASRTQITKNQLSSIITALEKNNEDNLVAQGKLYLAKMHCYDLSSQETINTVHQLLDSIINCNKESKSVVDEARFLLAMLCFKPGGQRENFTDENLSELLLDLNDHGKLSNDYRARVKMYLSLLRYEGRTKLIDNRQALDFLYEIYDQYTTSNLWAFAHCLGSIFEVRCGIKKLRFYSYLTFTEVSNVQLKNMPRFATSVNAIHGVSFGTNYIEAKKNLETLTQEQVLTKEDHAIAETALAEAEKLVLLCDKFGKINDKEHMLNLLKTDHSCIRLVSNIFLESPDFFIEALEVNFKVIRYIPSELYKNDKLALATLTHFITFIQNVLETEHFTKLNQVSNKILSIVQNSSDCSRSNIEFSNTALKVFDLLLEIIEKHNLDIMKDLITMYMNMKICMGKEIQKLWEQREIYSQAFLLRVLNPRPRYTEVSEFYLSNVPKSYLADTAFVMKLLKTNSTTMREKLCGENPVYVFDDSFLKSFAATYIKTKEIPQALRFNYTKLRIHLDRVAIMVELMPNSKRTRTFAIRVAQMIVKAKSCRASSQTLLSRSIEMAIDSLEKYIAKMPAKQAKKIVATYPFLRHFVKKSKSSHHTSQTY